MNCDRLFKSNSGKKRILVASHLRRNKPALKGQGKRKYFSEDRQSPIMYVCIRRSYRDLSYHISFSSLGRLCKMILGIPEINVRIVKRIHCAAHMIRVGRWHGGPWVASPSICYSHRNHWYTRSRHLHIICVQHIVHQMALPLTTINNDCPAFERWRYITILVAQCYVWKRSDPLNNKLRVALPRGAGAFVIAAIFFGP